VRVTHKRGAILFAGLFAGSLGDTMLDLKKPIGLATMYIGAGQDTAMFFRRLEYP